MVVPEDVLLILSLPGALKGGVFRPHGEGHPRIVEDLPTQQCAARTLGLCIRLRQGSIAGSVALQVLIIYNKRRTVPAQQTKRRTNTGLTKDSVDHDSMP